jgi:LuxR family maltose regulon positive regulatory protein
MGEVREIVALRPDLGSLLGEISELTERVAGLRGGVAGASTLTIAELRLLPLLTTHLTFREIGERLFVSQNTIKTQAISIYRKLDSASRSEAIERAVAVGLLESSGIPEPFIPPG